MTILLSAGEERVGPAAVRRDGLRGHGSCRRHVLHAGGYSVVSFLQQADHLQRGQLRARSDHLDDRLLRRAEMRHLRRSQLRRLPRLGDEAGQGTHRTFISLTTFTLLSLPLCLECYNRP